MTCFFIAGATGYTGSAAVTQLRDKKIRTLAHIRPDSPGGDSSTEFFSKLGAEVERCQWDEDALYAAMKTAGATHIMALLGTTRKKATAAAKRGEDASYEHVDRDLNLMLLRAAMRMENKPRFVYLSSMGAERPGSNRYLLARKQVEDAVLLAKISHVIARPAFITGADREEFRAAERIGAVIGDGLLGLAGLFGAKKLQNGYASMNASTLAEGLIRLALMDENIIAGPAQLRA